MKRIAIIGGGPGGLITAYLLEKKSSENLDITLFESNERVGGKILTRQFETAAVTYEAGVAEIYDYSHLGHDPLRHLIAELGLPTINMFGQTVVFGDRIMRHKGDIKRHFGKKTVKAIDNFRKRGSALLSPQNYYDAGWPDDNQHIWAQRSFQSVLAKIPDDAARRFLQVAVHSDLAIEPHLTNGLFGLENCLMDDPRYLRLYTIAGGIERLPQTLKQQISARVQLSCPVVRVEKTHYNTYCVSFRHNEQIESNDFDTVVLALPNYWLPQIEWGGKRLAFAMQEHHAYYDSPAHYLRISILFQKPFWRKLITDSYFQLDAFGGCCVYDESSRYDAGTYGVLSWLLGGSNAVIMSNYEDQVLIRKVLETLPKSLMEGRDLFIEGHVHRWLGTVSAQPGGHPIKGSKARHLPEPQEHPGLFVVGDYLFDSTINGVLDSADIATDMILNYFNKRKLHSTPTNHKKAKTSSTNKRDFNDYNGKRHEQKVLEEYFDNKYIIKLIDIVWGRKPPYRLLNSGAANGLTLAALAKEGIDAWGIENNEYIHKQTHRKLRHKNLLADIRALPFADNYFDFVYDTCLYQIPDSDIDQAMQELHRVVKYGICLQAVTDQKQLFDSSQSFHSTQEWSERFLRNGFQLAINEPQVLDKVWKWEKKVTAGETWYPTRESMRYCFYTKQENIRLPLMTELILRTASHLLS
ncbi:MAG: FAD-dependent oxidoreductase [Nostoc sp.]|uniref:FAD-dependent oxidoreductase n=1 Tax=Nostoc sp. TaxID=1180 RepID=UPI002FF2FE5D